ncbi:MAG: YifB family Mg chelatase-like AAA ATPase [Patescibacteria group bacterium]|nr:YifB family Mg chelatase-like AAA ATPase [Patescibacteria group bacterium]
MLAKVFSGATVGLDGVLIEVEVDVAEKGFPNLTIVGLPSKAIDEAKDRVRTAIINTSFEMPDCRITVNLAPADLPKEGSAFDLPIAVGILAAAGLVKKESLENSLFLGELSLEGRLRKVNGVIAIGFLAKKLGIKKLFLPEGNAKEASLIDDLEIYPVNCLADLIFHLNQQKLIAPFPKINLEEILTEEKYEFDFVDIKGQEMAKRTMIIAAAGFHNLHLKGPPGTGKTMLSRAFPSILPPLEKEEILEVSKIYSVAGQLSEKFFISSRPFRAPHHTISRIGLIGGGTNPTPGEISLAHRGVLFLDEFPEFPHSVLEALRQPLEDGKVTISRASGSLTFPSRFLLLAASNPCPCGYLGHPKKTCCCLPGAILKYKKRLSGPLLERIDLHIDVPPVEEEKLISYQSGVESKKIREKVIEARERQKKRFKGLKIRTNAEMGSAEVKKFCQLTNEAIDLLKQAISHLSLSARSYFKTIKIAQTIADLEKEEKIQTSFIAEALQYREKEG